MTLHASLSCHRPHPERQEMFVRALRRINNDSLGTDMAGIKIGCEDVNVIVALYDISLSRLLYNIAPLKKHMFC